MKKYKKVLFVVSMILVMVFSLSGCRRMKMTKCRYCDKMKYCQEIGIDGEAEMVCNDCAK